MLPAVEYDDLEFWLCGYLRPLLTEWSPVVDRLFPPPDWTAGFAVVVRDDSGPDESILTARRSVGMTVIGPSHQPAERLAQRVAYLIRAAPQPGPACPVARCAVRGPFSQPATGRSEFYLTADLIVVGHTL